MPGTGTPRTLSLTERAWQALAAIPRPVHGICPHCHGDVYVWAGRVACVDRNGSGRLCPGNGERPRRSASGGAR